MRHIFRLNVHQTGYGLFSVTPPEKPQEHPLDVKSADISSNYLAAQQALDNIITSHSSSWHVCICNMNVEENCVAAYGCRFAIKDDKDRSGVSFVHAVEVDGSSGCPSAVYHIARILSRPSVAFITQSLSAIAQGDLVPDSLFDYFIDQFSEEIPAWPTFGRKKTPPIKQIVHDCGGPLIAWLAMAASHVGESPPWLIYETILPSESFVSTVSTISTATEKWFLSEYIYSMVGEHEALERLPSLNSRGSKQIHQPVRDEKKSHSGGSMGPKEVPPLTQTVQVENDSTIAKNAEHKASQAESVTIRAEVIPSSRGGNPPHPPRSEVVQSGSEDTHRTSGQKIYRVGFHGFNAGELMLIREGNIFRVNFQNCVSISINREEYNFVVQIRSYIVLTETIVLVLPLYWLNGNQLRDVQWFVTRYYNAKKSTISRG